MHHGIIGVEVPTAIRAVDFFGLAIVPSELAAAAIRWAYTTYHSASSQFLISALSAMNVIVHRNPVISCHHAPNNDEMKAVTPIKATVYMNPL
jgi:hypothetical protein